MLIRERLSQYAYLMRLDRPIGILLLLWPTLWALWLAAGGRPNGKILLIFVLGVILTRSAGCVLNDFADRHVDCHVRRTRARPLASGKVTVYEAILIAGILCLGALLLVLQCNLLTIVLAFVGAGWMLIYPYLKRVTHLPQLGLGIAFSWGVPMAFAAETGMVDISAWILFIISAIWPVIYDTMYAMIDREDDLNIGVKSSAILFSAMDTMVIGLLQALFVLMLVIVGLIFDLRSVYYLSAPLVTVLFAYQQWLIRNRDPKQCFQAFLNNNWVGLVIFGGIFLSYLQ
ncbi:4-hydroxybenzoate octaprenyltransferase [Aquicella siphonis]|uniref:4-hydroxybenzoate octaprenyltransferase n=1 Tax=Aquicella siphonis TaxID=254247 RepID=A0A5E4PI95_9COXI|nr:4-hydroxybenzoate octaprenyltransferase [Aquicella siphonis]VVC76664.1 4-hydroxybenzoate octaprenyltransferase [Aquicella siphonis]